MIASPHRPFNLRLIKAQLAARVAKPLNKNLSKYYFLAISLRLAQSKPSKVQHKEPVVWSRLLLLAFFCLAFFMPIPVMVPTY
ncbi:hypothetical protein, partial [Pantoea sp. UBA4389]|uniref:hypothetical protein n=1 Tax=Pantoea sp. UBA4389 TaxID=1947032 RepID=UPI0028935B25